METTEAVTDQHTENMFVGVTASRHLYGTCGTTADRLHAAAALLTGSRGNETEAEALTYQHTDNACCQIRVRASMVVTWCEARETQ